MLLIQTTISGGYLKHQYVKPVNRLQQCLVEGSAFFQMNDLLGPKTRWKTSNFLHSQR